MSDKKPRRSREVIEKEAGEQQLEADKLKEEVDGHKKRIEALEEVVKELREQQRELQSRDTDNAFEAVEAVQDHAKEMIEAARSKRDELLADNRFMYDKVSRSLDAKNKTQKKIDLIMKNAPDFEKGRLDGARAAIKMDADGLGLTKLTLDVAKRKLEALSL